VPRGLERNREKDFIQVNSATTQEVSEGAVEVATENEGGKRRNGAFHEYDLPGSWEKLRGGCAGGNLRSSSKVWGGGMIVVPGGKVDLMILGNNSTRQGGEPILG